MVVQHNLTAMNSNRMLGLTTSSQAKATEKLSSGYKINRAADDAAGLAISEKMRKQIRGLTQASLNAQDGISAVQTAEGALTEVHDMLQRMNELAVKAANGTMSESDRSAVQSEIDQLVTEIDRVSTTTKFNETYLLKGSNNGTAGKLKYDTSDTKLSGKFGSAQTAKLGTLTYTVNQGSWDKNTGVGTIGVTKISNITIRSYDNTKSVGQATVYAVSVGKQTFVYVKSTATATQAMVAAGAPKSSGSVAVSVATAVKNMNHVMGAEGVNKNSATVSFYTSMDEMMSAIRHSQGNAEHIKSVSSYYDLAANGGAGTVTIKIETFADLNDALDFSLHVGADSSDDNKINVNIAQMGARGLGVNGLMIDGTETSKATSAIDVIADALQKVSNQRATLGAVQNRLEHTIKNLDNIVENTTSAESAVRDTDMATQMVEYSNNNILAQAGQAMLAQSNQTNQGVLSLLG